jgi:hypothetical protein
MKIFRSNNPKTMIAFHMNIVYIYSPIYLHLAVNQYEASYSQ